MPVRFLGVCLLILTACVLTVPRAEAISSGFIQNRGQLDERVLFYGTGQRGTVYFTRDALVFDLRDEDTQADVEQTVEASWETGAGRHPRFSRGPASAVQLAGEPRSSQRRGCAVWLCFDGADSAPRVEAREELPGRYNFFLGNDPARWRTDVPSYGEVVYPELWPGVDLVFRSQDGALTYEMVAQNGAAPQPSRFLYKGVEQVMDRGGPEVWLETSAGWLVEVRPGAGSREGRFLAGRALGEIDGEDVGLGDRDDPSALLWGTFLGGSSDDDGDAIVLDTSGDPVLAGRTESSDFPTTPGAYDASLAGHSDAFVAKLSGTGSRLLWSTLLGGGDMDCTLSVALDASGNPVLTGYTYSSDFPTTPGAFDTSFNGGLYDAFVVKLSGTGSSLLWSTFLGGNDYDRGYAIVPDSSDNPVVMGYALSADFPTTAGAYNTSINGSVDAFVTKLSSTGSSLLWSTFLGGSDVEEGYALALDTSGNSVLTGLTWSSDFPTTPGAFDTSFNGGGYDVFVAKLSSTGSSLLWGTFLGGNNLDRASALALNAAGEPILTGSTVSSDFPTTPGAYDASLDGYSDAFVARLSGTGSILLFSTFLGGSGGDGGVALALDISECPVLTGLASSTFPTTPGAYDTSYNGGDHDAFVAKLSSPQPQGACCNPTTGTCTITTSLECVAPNVWHGEWTTCEPNPCPRPGACCYVDGTCRQATQEGCQPPNNYQGDGTLCLGNQCPPSAIEAISRTAESLTLTAAPNPSSREVSILYGLPTATAITLEIFDAAGVLVRQLVEGQLPAGSFSTPWDGRDDNGREVPTGVYFARVVTPQGTKTGRVILAR